VQFIFVCIFIFAVLVGVFAKAVNSDKTSFVGYFVNSIGLKDQTDEQKNQMRSLVAKFSLEKNKVSEYLKNQQAYMGSSQNEIGSFSQIIKEMSARHESVDLLRLKQLMKDFSDQNTLLIENGQKLVELKEKQKKANEVGFNRFLQGSRDQLTHQREFIDEQIEKNKELKEKVAQMQVQIRQIRDDAISKEDSQVLDKLQFVSNKTMANLDQLKSQQDELKSMNTDNLSSIESVRDKVEDIKQKNRDKIEETSQRIKDQNDQLKDRIRDQMEKAKSRKI
jgi:hypothetical protein